MTFSSREEKETVHLSGLWRRIERKMRSQIYIVRKREGLDLKVRCSTSATNFTHDFGESHNLGCLETLSVKCDRHASFMKHSVGKDHSCEGFRC